MLEIKDSATYNAIAIQEGQYPTPEVLNRPSLGLLNNDLILEQAINMVSRSGGSYLITDNTKFLSHFNDTTKDSIGGIMVEDEALGTVPTTLIKDNVFEGAFFGQDSSKNLLSNNASIASSLATLDGWTISSTNNKINTVTVLATSAGLTLDNSALLDSYPLGNAVYAPGSISCTSQKYSIEAASASSITVQMSTTDNLAYRDIVVDINVLFYDGADALLDTGTVSLSPVTYNGLITLEGITVPVGATQAAAEIVVNYNALQASTYPSVATITFKNFMHSSTSTKKAYVATTLGAAYLEYKEVINAASDFSVFCWANVSKIQLDTYSKNFGPLFLVASDGYGSGSIGFRHLSSDAGIYSFLASSTATAGSKFTVSVNDLGTYRPILIRKRVVNSAVEVQALMLGVDGALYKSTLTPSDFLATKMNIVIGKDPDQSGLSYFNGGVTELRYDAEWLNDAQFTVLALNTRPFRVGNESADDTWTKPNPNLIKNPEGKLGTYYWANTPAEFDSLVEDPEFGCGFTWTSGSSTTYDITSTKIPIAGGLPIVFSGTIEAAADSTGTIGLKVSYYNSENVYLGYSSVAAYAGGEAQRYTIKATTPSTTAYAHAIIWLAGATSSRVVWTKLKLEQSTYPTIFTDDFTPAYAVYAED